MSGLNWLSIEEALAAMKAGTLADEALAEAAAWQIARLNGGLGAFITVIEPARRGMRGRGRLAGIPIAIKDLIETMGVATTAGSLFFEDHVPDMDAFVVDKLKREGAVIMGKTNTHEIALGVTTVNPHYGTCHNPWDLTRVSGGSSGGSAVAVATGMATAALGTDTGGSIRIPASLCGVVGLKPTYGRVSVRGVIPLSWNLDHVGAMTRTVRDAAIMLQATAGYDEQDPFCADEPVEDYLLNIEAGVKGWRLAIATGPYVEGSDPEVLCAFEEATGVFDRLGANLHSVDVSFLREAALANGLITTADAAAYHRERLAGNPERFGTDVRQRLETGRAYPSTEYVLARKTQSEMKHRLKQFFQEYDTLLIPSTPITAPRIEGNDAVSEAARLTRFTAPFNLTGLPAISFPCGFSGDGLPIGLQIAAGAWKEASVLQAARAYEKATAWGKKRPGISEQ